MTMYPPSSAPAANLCSAPTAVPFSAPAAPLQTVGRLAPSPTGYLHLGNAWAFLLAWLAARHTGGRVILRMEDIDPDRSRPHFAQAIMDDLRWLGLDWDEGPNSVTVQTASPDSKTVPTSSPVAPPASSAPYVQSQRGDYYRAALQHLHAHGHTYPCYCTRKELRTLAAAPHVGDAGAPYPSTCRNLTPPQRAAHEADGRRAALRLRCPQGEAGSITFIDHIQGPQHMTLDDCGGDFALRRSDGVVAYQLAVVVDDALMGVTHIVRGDDIRISTPRQILLYRLLGYPVPSYAHVPLLLDHAGERLAKRHASLTLGSLRDAGVRAPAIVGYLAHKAGLLPQAAACTAQKLIPLFCMKAIPTQAQICPPKVQDVLLQLTQA